MKITPLQQYVILGVLGFLVLSFLFYQFALKPINREISSLEAKRDQEKKDLEEAKKIVAKYVEFKKRADSIQRELEWIQNRIPKTIDKPKMVEVITSLQNRSGISLTDFKFSTAASASTNSSYTEIPVNIKFNSDYNGLLKFIYQMSLSNLIMTAHDVVVTAVSPVDPTHPDITLSTQMILSGIQAK